MNIEGKLGHWEAKKNEEAQGTRGVEQRVWTSCILVHVVLFPPSFLHSFIALFFSQEVHKPPLDWIFPPFGKSGRGVITSACLAEAFSSWYPILRKCEDSKEDPLIRSCHGSKRKHTRSHPFFIDNASFPSTDWGKKQNNGKDTLPDIGLRLQRDVYKIS